MRRVSPSPITRRPGRSAAQHLTAERCCAGPRPPLYGTAGGPFVLRVAARSADSGLSCPGRCVRVPIDSRLTVRRVHGVVTSRRAVLGMLRARPSAHSSLDLEDPAGRARDTRHVPLRLVIERRHVCSNFFGPYVQAQTGSARALCLFY